MEYSNTRRVMAELIGRLVHDVTLRTELGDAVRGDIADGDQKSDRFEEVLRDNGYVLGQNEINYLKKNREVVAEFLRTMNGTGWIDWPEAW